ncbi:MAG TPA: hypothetical protein PLB62_00010 [Candidatus Sumerlaeota bacterium]|nr:hypothetical protein [Candidatus Sumerlaeota bacterium]
MKTALDNIDLHIVIVGIMLAVLGVLLAASRYGHDHAPGWLLLAVFLGLFEVVLQPMILTRGLDRSRRGRNRAYILVNEAVVVLLALLSFSVFQIIR